MTQTLRLKMKGKLSFPQVNGMYLIVSRASSTDSVTSRIRDYRILHGRTFHNYNNEAYWLVS